MNARRSKTRVILDILLAIQREGKAKPTHILYKANLSHRLLKSHLNDLLAKGLIEKVEDRKNIFYTLTPKGNEIISEFRKVEKLALAFGLPI
jgi:predicted transcriptional regulator